LYSGGFVACSDWVGEGIGLRRVVFSGQIWYSSLYNTMKIHLLTILIGIAIMVVSTLGRAQNIVAVHDEQGHIIWSNDWSADKALKPDALKPDKEPKLQSPAPVAAAASEPQPRAEKLVYWSRKEHRWKTVKTPSPATMKAAREAAWEVTSGANASPAGSSLTRKTRAGAEWAPSSHASLGGSQPAVLSPPSSKSVEEAIDAAASRHGVNANLVRAVIQVESNFNPHAVSRKGAMGLMQLMPHTAKSMNVTNVFDPQENVDAGVRHLKSLLENYNGDLSLSLAAYNAGSGAVEKHKGIPPYRETRDYVKKITDLYRGPALAQAPLKPQIRMSRDSQGRLFFSTE